jgi:hypothetical protein
MKKPTIIKICETLPINTLLENSIIEAWKNDRNGNINVSLLEKIKLVKYQKTIENGKR